MPEDARAHAGPHSGVNVGAVERVLSVMLGAILVAFGVTRRRPAAKLLAVPGALLLARAGSGRSLLYTLFDVSTQPRTGAGMPEREGEPAEGAATGAGAAAAGAQPGPDSPHPRVPGTHAHPVPPNELGVPTADVTPKLMREVAVPSSASGEEEGGEE